MYCESCGSFIPDGQSFCSNCGSPAPQAAPQPVAQPAPQPVAQPAVQPVAQPVAQSIPVAQPVAQSVPVAQPVAQAVPVAQSVPVQPVYQQPVYTQPVYTQPVMVAAAPVKRGNGAATAGLVFGILALVLSWIPGFNIFTTALFGLLGLIFSIVGLVKKNAGGKGKAVAGLILTVLAVIVTIVYYVAIASYLTNELGDLDEDTVYSWLEEFETMDMYDTAFDYTDSDFYINGDYVTTENGYVSGVLHIDTYSVDFN